MNGINMNEMKIGKYCNRIGYSDVYPFEVVNVISDKTVEIREMDAERDPSFTPEFVEGGFSGVCVNQHEQKWIYKSKPNSPIFRVRYSKAKKRWQDKGGNQYRMADIPLKYYDYNF